MKRLSSLFVIIFLLIPSLCFGAFPTTGVLDNFDRANGNIGANWTETYNGFNVISNTVRGDSSTAGNYGYWNTASYGADSEVYISIASEAAYTECYVYARWDPDNGNGYAFNFYTTGGTDEAYISRFDGFGETQLGSTFTQEFSNGDSYGLEVIGTSSNLKAYYKASAGSWGQLGTTQSDGTYTGTGRVSLGIYQATATMDNFGGGTVVVAAAAPEGQVIWW